MSAGSIAGLVISIIAVLGLSISLYWAAQEETTKTREIKVPKFKDVTKTKIEKVANRIPVPTVISTEPTSVTRWGTVPGSFASTYLTGLTINNYSEDFLNTHAMAHML
jgi:hypothetical protein